MCKTAVISGIELSNYSFGESHPWNSNRFHAFSSRIDKPDIKNNDNLRLFKPQLASETSLYSFHDKGYVNFVKESSVLGGISLDNADTPAFKGVFEASLYVVGSTLLALDIVANKTEGIIHAFNPIGGLHHARKDSAGGFCVFSDIGIAIMYARQKYGINKILYIDIDAHHGDGVYYEFDDDTDVIIGDIHEDGMYLYPGTGFESEKGVRNARGTKLNLSLKPGATDTDFINKFTQIEDFIKNMKTDLVIFQCGADGLNNDPITHLKYTPKSYKYAAEIIHKFAHLNSDKRLIGLGGGGYNVQNIANAWGEVLNVFLSNYD